MTRIFLPLCGLSWLCLAAAFLLGLLIGDPKLPDPAIQRHVQFHFLTALGALVFALMVHALVLTYFMGTGRWIEETSSAYRLEESYYNENQRLKYRVLPGLVSAVLALMVTGGFGAASDPAAAGHVETLAGWPMATVHQTIAIIALCGNLLVNYFEFIALSRNGEIVDAVLGRVRQIREAKGLAV